MIVLATIEVTRDLRYCHACGTILPAWDCCASPDVQVEPCYVEQRVSGEIDSFDARRPCWGDFADIEPADLSNDEHYRACKALLAALQEHNMERDVDNFEQLP